MNEGDVTRAVTLALARDGTAVYEQTFRSYLNTTVLGQIDHIGNYTLTLSVIVGSSVTETLAVS